MMMVAAGSLTTEVVSGWRIDNLGLRDCGARIYLHFDTSIGGVMTRHTSPSSQTLW